MTRSPVTEEQPLLSTTSTAGNAEQLDDQLDEDVVGRKKELEKAFVRRLDRRMSILVLIYILNYVDRNNVAAARLHGFEEDLHLEGTQFASVLSVLYIGYVAMQVPSNMFLNHIGRPSTYLPLCMVAWGLLSVCMGLMTTFFGAISVRFLLGFVEAAFFPGALFLLSKWYKRNELSERTAYLASGILLSNAFGSFIASGILKVMDGFLGFSAWRWLFFVEGTLTVIVAIWSMYILPDFPENASNWLTPAEQALALERMAQDADQSSSSHDPMGDNSSGKFLGRWSGLRLAIADWKVWWLSAALFCMILALSFGVYMPTLAATLGYGPTISLLLCVPPWLFATATSLALARDSDAKGERSKHITFSLTIGILGFVLATTTMNGIVRYFSMFLMTQAYGGFICFFAWASGSVSHPPAKRAVALALINCISQLGNVFGSYIWPTSWGPTYNASYSICALMHALCITMCLFFRLRLSKLNHQMDSAEEQGLRTRFRYIS